MNQYLEAIKLLEEADKTITIFLKERKMLEAIPSLRRNVSFIKPNFLRQLEFITDETLKELTLKFFNESYSKLEKDRLLYPYTMEWARGYNGRVA